MASDDILLRARDLGADHADENHQGKLHHRLHSGREIAAALGVADELDGDQYVALRSEYAYGWSSWA